MQFHNLHQQLHQQVDSANFPLEFDIVEKWRIYTWNLKKETRLLHNAWNLKHTENTCWDNKLTNPLTGLPYFNTLDNIYDLKPKDT